MNTEYELWKKRGKKQELTPIWAAASTFIFAPIGYWLVGEGIKGLKYTIIIFFAGYVSLGLATFIGSIILTIDVYRKAKKLEAMFLEEGKANERSDHTRLIKILILFLLLIFIIISTLFFSIA